MINAVAGFGLFQWFSRPEKESQVVIWDFKGFQLKTPEFYVRDYADFGRDNIFFTGVSLQILTPTIKFS